MEFVALPSASPGGVARRVKKRTKAGVLVSSIQLADLEACFHLPTEKACVRLGVGLTILKRLCRKFGIARWPYRSLLKSGKAQRASPAPSSPQSPPYSPLACDTPAGSAEGGCARAFSGAASSQGDFCGSASGPPVREAAPDALPPAASTAATALAALPPPPPAAPAELPKSGSQLTLLLSAIEACEQQGASQPDGGEAQLATPAGAGPATAFPARPFAHGARSAFRAAPRRAGAELAAAAAAQRRLLLAAALRRLAAQRAPPPPPSSAAAQLQLVQQLLQAREALASSRAARRHAQQAAAPPASRFAPYAAAPPSPKAASRRSSMAADLASARSLLAQYSL